MRTRRWLLHGALLAAGLTALAAGALPAQQHATDRGSWILGGSSGMASQTMTLIEDGERRRRTQTHFHFSPRVQHFVVRGLAVGGGVELSHVRFDDHSGTRYGAGPTVGYFFGAAEERSVVPYLSAQASYSDVSNDDFAALDYGAAAGALYMLTSSVALDGSLFFRAHRPTGREVDVRDRVLGAAIGFSAFVF